MGNTKKSLSVIFCAVSATSFIVIYFYPTGDWMTGPLLLSFLGIPVMIVQIVLCLATLFWVKRSTIIVLLQGLLGVACLYIMQHYIYTHRL